MPTAAVVVTRPSSRRMDTPKSANKSSIVKRVAFTVPSIQRMPNALTVEIDQTGNPFIDELLVEPLTMRDGMLSLSDRPGLGIELNEKVVERYRLADPLYLPAGFYSDMVFGNEGLAPPPPYQENA